ncbi:MAG: DUF898 domain-containing protein [Candidatus Paracaedibacteraceae bacterium]|nr:DUF898 domain-containing protein [Candidatus Paracaedibacteraceae bacterium]
MSSQDHNSFCYDGNYLTVFMLYAKLFIGTLLTLGIYNFWGRTNIRRYLTGSILLRQERYQYHGTGEELFLSFLKILAQTVVYLAVNALILWAGIHHLGWDSDRFVESIFILNIIFIQGIFFYAIHKILKYRFSRLSWRGVRYHLDGSSWQFTKLCFIKSILNTISLGVLIPRSTLESYSLVMNNLYFGDQRYRFKFDSHNLLKPHLISLLLFIPTLGFSRVWYGVKLHKFMAEHLEFMDLKFINTATVKGMLSLYLTNSLIIVCTIGLGIPLAVHRSIKYHIENLKIVGDLDRKRLIQARAHG